MPIWQNTKHSFFALDKRAAARVMSLIMDGGFHFHGTQENSNPFDHDTLESGYCSVECPACKWMRQQKLWKTRDELKYPPRTLVPTETDLEILHALKIAWDGDIR